MTNQRKKQVAIIDYKMSNLFSVQHACKYVGLQPIITSDPAEVLSSDAAILPGVGAFGDAMKNLKDLELIETINLFVNSGKQFLGICLGLQLLFSKSEEFGSYDGLNLIKGNVKRFPLTDASGKIIKVPQIGWNTIYPPHNSRKRWRRSPLENTPINEFMYFVHSFFVVPENINDILTLTTYEETEYCSSIQKNNITAFQFHPEKSGPEGVKIYTEWAKKI